MKTNEELKALAGEIKTIEQKLGKLSEEELPVVTGGLPFPHIDPVPYKPIIEPKEFIGSVEFFIPIP